MADSNATAAAAAEELAQFQHECDQLMFWINYKEVIVWPEELKSIGGENPSAADDSGCSAAVKEKLAQFNREVEAQQIRVDQLMTLADVMMQSGHPDALTIARRKQDLKQSWQRMRKLALKRQMFGRELASVQPPEPVVTAGAPAAATDGLVDAAAAAAAGGIVGLLHHPTGSSGGGATPNINQVAAEAHLLRGLLEDCLRLQQFDADCDVTKRYIETNMTSALEQNHLDPTGLNAKVQQHRKFEEELFSRQNRVQVLVKIHTQLNDIIQMWEKLLAATQVKSVHLSQAWQQERFNQGVDNMNQWLDQVEAALASPDVGSDLASVQQLIIDDGLLERDVQHHKEIVDIITTAAQQFAESRHFDLDTIQKSKNGVVKRFDGLAKLMADRKRKLADSLLVQQLYNDINTEENWIKEKEAMITGRASCIESVRAMIRTTQSIMQAMHEHENHVVALVDRGRKLAASMTAHLAELSAQVKQRSDQLAENWAAMKEKAFQRKQSNQLVLLFLFNIKD